MEINVTHPNSPNADLLPCGAVQCRTCERIIHEKDRAGETADGEYLCMDHVGDLISPAIEIRRYDAGGADGVAWIVGDLTLVQEEDTRREAARAGFKIKVYQRYEFGRVEL